MFEYDKIVDYVRKAANARGMDPDKIVRALQTEGLAPGIWQSNAKKGSLREPSYGPMQLLVGGKGTGFPEGLGNAFMRDTGLDPSDPSNVFSTIDYGLDTVAKEGWRQWYGPKNAGLDRWYGVKGSKPAGVTLTNGPQVSPESIDFMRRNPQPGGFGPKLEKLLQPNASPAGGTFPSAPNQPSTMGVLADGFKNSGFLGGMKLAGNTMGGAMNPLMGIMGALMGGGQKQQSSHSQPLQSSLPAMESSDAARMATARQSMDQLLASRRRRVPGLSLMG